MDDLSSHVDVCSLWVRTKAGTKACPRIGDQIEYFTVFIRGNTNGDERNDNDRYSSNPDT